jgi:nucleoid-associated protein YgaU
MKPWAELTAGARGARVGGVVAVVAAILWGVFSLRGGPHGGPEGDEKPVVAEAEAGKVAPVAEPAAEAAPATQTPAAVEESTAPAETAAAEPADEPAAEPAEAPADETAAEPAEEPAAAPAETAAEPATPVLPAAPTLDLVRIDQDGSAVIAGKGTPGSTLSLRVDGVEVIAIPADASGSFVGMFSLPPSDAARALSVVMVLADGTEVPAGATVVIAPTVAAVIAQAETVTEPAAEPAQTAAAEPAATETAATETAETQTAEPAAAEAPAALMVTDEGAKVLQGIGDGTVAATNVTIDAISYTPEGAVVLAGRGTAGALVRLYLDNAATAEATVAQAGDWSVTLTDIKPGIYTLRVDQLDAEGNVTSRFETPFKRESLEALAAAAAPAATEPAATEPAPVKTATVEPAAPEPAAEASATTETAAETVEPAAAPAPEVAATAAEPAATTEVASAEPAVEPAATTSAEPTPAPVATEVVAEAPAAEPAPTVEAPAPIQITVQPGFTLWRIARENLGDGFLYVQVFEANKDQIRDPDLIYPGQIFTLAPKE